MNLRAFFQKRDLTGAQKFQIVMNVFGVFMCLALVGMYAVVFLVDWRVGLIFVAVTGILVRIAIAIAQAGAWLYAKWQEWSLKRQLKKMLKAAKEFEAASERLLKSLEYPKRMEVNHE